MVVMQEIDTSNGVIFPFYDQDTSVIYLCGKVGLCVCVYLYRSVSICLLVSDLHLLFNIVILSHCIHLYLFM